MAALLLAGCAGVKVKAVDGSDYLTQRRGDVPCRSAHLPGAASELVLPSWHSVQETPQAIVEIRRILQAHLDDRVAGGALP